MRKIVVLLLAAVMFAALLAVPGRAHAQDALKKRRSRSILHPSGLEKPDRHRVRTG